MQQKSLGVTVLIFIFNMVVGSTQLAQTTMISHRIIHNRALPYLEAEMNEPSERRREKMESIRGSTKTSNQGINDGVIVKRNHEPSKYNDVYGKRSDEISIVQIPSYKASRELRQSDERENSRELGNADYDDIREGGGYLKYFSEESVKEPKSTSKEKNYNNHHKYNNNYNSDSKPYGYPKRVNGYQNEFSGYQRPYENKFSEENQNKYREASDEDDYTKTSYGSSSAEYSNNKSYKPTNEDRENPEANYEVTEKITEETVTTRPRGKIVGVPPPCARVVPPPLPLPPPPRPKPIPRYYGPIHRAAAVAASRRPLYRIRAPMYVVRRPILVRQPPRVLHVHHYHPPKQQSLQLQITRIPTDDERRRRYRRLVPYRFGRSKPKLLPAPSTTLSPLDLAALAYPI